MSSQNRFRVVVGDGPTVILQDGKGHVLNIVAMQIDYVQEGDIAQLAARIMESLPESETLETQERDDVLFWLKFQLERLQRRSRILALVDSYMVDRSKPL